MTDATRRAWTWIQRQSSFTRDELAAELELPLKNCSTIIQNLKKRGVIKATAYRTGERFKGGFTPKRYKAVSGAVYRGRGESTRPKHRNGTGQQCVWQSMRMLRTFTYPDLEATAEVSMSTARTYCSLLQKHGYVKMIRTPRHLPNKEREGKVATYRLVKDTGPIAPKRQGEGIHDANLKKEGIHEVA